MRKKRRTWRKKGEGTGRGTGRKIIDLSKTIKSIEKYLLTEKSGS